MTALILKPTGAYCGDEWPEDDYVVLDRGKVVGRIMVEFGDATWAPVVLDNHCTRASAVNSQSRKFSDTRASDAGFQSAVVNKS